MSPAERRANRSWQRRLFVWLSVLTLGWMLLLGQQGKPLKNPVACSGILAFEMPGDAQQASAIVAAWRQEGVIETARWQILLDFPFLVLYPAWFATGLGLLLGRVRSGGWRRSGRILQGSTLLMAGLDAGENYLMLGMLDGPISEAMARTVTLLAGTKFLLVALALAWWLLASVLGQADREDGFPSNPQ